MRTTTLIAITLAASACIAPTGELTVTVLPPAPVIAEVGETLDLGFESTYAVDDVRGYDVDPVEFYLRQPGDGLLSITQVDVAAPPRAPFAAVASTADGRWLHSVAMETATARHRVRVTCEAEGFTTVTLHGVLGVTRGTTTAVDIRTSDTHDVRCDAVDIDADDTDTGPDGVHCVRLRDLTDTSLTGQDGVAIDAVTWTSGSNDRYMLDATCTFGDGVNAASETCSVAQGTPEGALACDTGSGAYVTLGGTPGSLVGCFATGTGGFQVGDTLTPAPCDPDFETLASYAVDIGPSSNGPWTEVQANETAPITLDAADLP